MQSLVNTTLISTTTNLHCEHEFKFTGTSRKTVEMTSQAGHRGKQSNPEWCAEAEDGCQQCTHAFHFPYKKLTRASVLWIRRAHWGGMGKPTRGGGSEEARYKRHGTIAPQERHFKRRPFPDPKHKADTPPQQLICGVCCSIYTHMILAWPTVKLIIRYCIELF